MTGSNDIDRHRVSRALVPPQLEPVCESDVVAELANGAKAWVIPDKMLALERLSADLANVDAWVPPDLWAGGWTPYRPERFLLMIDPQRDTPPEAVPRGPDADECPGPLATAWIRQAPRGRAETPAANGAR